VKRYFLIAAAAGLLWSAGAMAAEKTVTLAIKNMSCASCPYIVKKSLTRVPGVSKVNVSFKNRIAVVTFDDKKTGIAALTGATADMGFPSSLKK
jgi:periplasmic mercuric ion binding protein